MPTTGAETIKATQTRLLGVKIAQFRSCAPKLYIYRRKCRLKYLEHVVKEDKSPQQRHRIVAEQLTVVTARKCIFTSVLSNVVTFRQRKRRKLARKHVHNITLQMHMSKLSVRIHWRLWLTWPDWRSLAHARVSTGGRLKLWHLFGLWV